jgi:hypothetical protein
VTRRVPLLFVVAVALAFAACDRFIDLTPPPDARGSDGGPIGDSFLPDAGLDGGGIKDALPLD